MKITDIIDSWKRDAIIDDLNVDKSSAGVPMLHAKYAEMLVTERSLLRSLELTRRSLEQTIRNFYLGVLTQEELEQLKRDPYPQRILKSEVTQYIISDPDIITLDAKIANQQEKVELLFEIMKSINGRNYTLKNIIDWKRTMLGG